MTESQDKLHSLQALEAGKGGSVTLKVNSPSDYPILSTIIQPNDVIMMNLVINLGGRFRRKQIVEKIFATLTVEELFVEDKIFGVRGSYTSPSLSGRTRVWLSDGQEFCLTKACWSHGQIQALSKLNKSNAAPESLTPQESSASQAIEGKSIAEFRKLMRANSPLITYGDKYVLCAANVGAVRSLIMTEDCLSKQDTQTEKEISKSSKKFRGAQVIILEKSSPHCKEIGSYGGAVAILKYPFDPGLCM
jgi:stalled ribosome rescue protein Dom34